MFAIILRGRSNTSTKAVLFGGKENGNKKKPPVEQKEEEVGELLRANNHRRQKEPIYLLLIIRKTLEIARTFFQNFIIFRIPQRFLPGRNREISGNFRVFHL
jgi:hypothetical protein